MAIIVFGAGGGLGQALVKELQSLDPEQRIFAVSRQAQSARENVVPIQWHGVNERHDVHAAVTQAMSAIDAALKPDEEITGVLSTIGILHNDQLFPEKRLDELSASALMTSYQINAVLPMVLMQATVTRLPKKSPAFWVQLSAMVGSITDNKLGGWYSYRASKAGLNMLMKTAAIELARSHKQLTVAAIHPGTTDTPLSEPFQARIADGKLYSRAQSAERIVAVIKQLQPAQSGCLFNWNGEVLAY